MNSISRSLACLIVVLFVWVPASQCQTFVHTFSGGASGIQPSGLARGNDGNFYGTAYGGANSKGIIFKVSPEGNYQVVYSFNKTDGEVAGGTGLTISRANDGSLYGITGLGGASNSGTIFKLSPDGIFSSLYSFSGAADGSYPATAPIQGRDGNLYGLTRLGGNPNGNGVNGVIYKITPGGVFTKLYTFTGGSKDGRQTLGGLVEGDDGNFYGATTFGGSKDKGVVFRISPGGVYKVLYILEGKDGAGPQDSLVKGSDGVFYGTTASGGASNEGVVFRITSQGSFTLLHSFSSSNQGGRGAFGGLIQVADGSFLGTTGAGGVNDAGTIYRITSLGEFNTLASFTVNPGNTIAYSGLVQNGPGGKFYGSIGGGGGNGGIYRFDFVSPPVPEITPVALPGQAAEGISGAVFADFGMPAINESGYSAFAATLKTGVAGVGKSNNAGIWADNAEGERQLIARTGANAPGAGSDVFTSLKDPVYNNNGAVAFQAGYGSSKTGIWSNTTGVLTLIVRLGAQAPGFSSGTTFGAFNAFALPDQGGIILLASTGSGKSTSQGIWAVDTTGNLKLVVRTGQLLGGRTVAGLGFLPANTPTSGQTRSFNQGRGDLAFLVTFSDKTTGIFKVVFP